MGNKVQHARPVSLPGSLEELGRLGGARDYQQNHRDSGSRSEPSPAGQVKEASAQHESAMTVEKREGNRMFGASEGLRRDSCLF